MHVILFVLILLLFHDFPVDLCHKENHLLVGILNKASHICSALCRVFKQIEEEEVK